MSKLEKETLIIDCAKYVRIRVFEDSVLDLTRKNTDQKFSFQPKCYLVAWCSVVLTTLLKANSVDTCAYQAVRNVSFRKILRAHKWMILFLFVKIGLSAAGLCKYVWPFCYNQALKGWHVKLFQIWYHSTIENN